MRSIAFVSGIFLTTAIFAAGCGEPPPETSGTAGTGGTTSTTSTTTTTSETGGTGGTVTGGGGTGGTGGTTTTTPMPNPDIVSVSPISLFESEASIAAAPNELVAVAFIAINQTGSSIGVTFSTDSGETFGAVQKIDGAGLPRQSDPVLSVDAQSNFYLTWIGFKLDGAFSPTDMHVYVAKAPAGMTTFDPPVEVSMPVDPNDHFDKPWITVTSQGTLLVTYAREETGDILVGRSTDLGDTWTNHVVVSDGTFHNLAYPCASSSGRVYTVYHAIGGSLETTLRYSDDDGVTWAAASELLVSEVGEDVAFEDTTCVADGQDVWVSYGTSQDPFGGGNLPLLDSVRVARSADGGQTIESRTDAQDAAAGKLFFLPQLAREAGGALDLVYYVGEMEGDKTGSFRRSRSTDGGATWTPSAEVWAPITFTGKRDTPEWLGDYVGIATLGGALFSSYADNTGGFSHIATFKTDMP